MNEWKGTSSPVNWCSDQVGLCTRTMWPRGQWGNHRMPLEPVLPGRCNAGSLKDAERVSRTRCPAFCGLGCQFPVDKPNLGTQMQAAGIKWRSYQESMGTPCKLSGAGPYAPKHDPFLYFTDMQKGANNLCANTNVDYTQFAADLAAGTYPFSFITPNLTSDGHDPSTDPVAALKTSDAWAKTEIDKIMASNAYKNGGVIFITWDEAEGRNGDSADQVPMIVVTPGIKSPGYKSNVAYSHANYLATVEDIFGLPRLGAAVGKASMKEFWQ